MAFFFLKIFAVKCSGCFFPIHPFEAVLDISLEPFRPLTLHAQDSFPFSKVLSISLWAIPTLPHVAPGTVWVVGVLLSGRFLLLGSVFPQESWFPVLPISTVCSWMTGQSFSLLSFSFLFLSVLSLFFLFLPLSLFFFLNERPF